MRKLAVAMATILACAGVAGGAAIASDYEKRGGEAYRDSGRHENKIYGSIEALPKDRVGTWVVSGREVLVTKSTYIEEEHGRTAVGAYVEVEGSRTGGSFTARKIEVKGNRR